MGTRSKVVLLSLGVALGTVWAGAEPELGAPGAPAAERPPVVKVVVVSPRGKQAAAAGWEQVAQYLSLAIPGTRFAIRAIDLPELEGAIAEPGVQFAFTNPGSYVLLEQRHGTTRMLTALPLGPGGEAYSHFGSVVFARKDSGIRTLHDLAGKRLAVIDTTSFGGSLLAASELRAAGVREEDLEFVPLGFPQQKVVEAVLRGDFPAGSVRTDILERMAATGAISLDQLVVLDEKHHPGFHYLISTALYPEWAFSSVADADPALTRAVASALLALPSSHPAAKAIGLHGFTAPLDYRPVHAVLQQMRVAPYENWEMRETLFETLLRSWQLLAAMGAAVSVLLGLGWLRQNRRRVRELTLRHEALLSLNSTIERRVQERTSELEASREQFRALVEGIHALPWEMDARSRRFNYVGPQAGLLLGCPETAWLAEGFLEQRLHPSERDGVAAAFAPSASRDADHEFRMRRDDGEWVWVRCIHGSTREVLDQVHLNGLLVDVTERHRLEFDLLQAQKLESVGRLAGGIAHEINTPMQFIGDSVNFLRDGHVEVRRHAERYEALRAAVVEQRPLEGPLAALSDADADGGLAELLVDLEKATALCLEGTERVTTIVRSMKEFAHPDQGRRSMLDLNRALTSTLAIARHEYKDVADIVTDFGEVPPLHCYVGELNQAFLNIIVNAAHAIAEAAALTKDGARGAIRISTRLVGEVIKVSIGDTGRGIPEEIRGRIFDPFFTTKALGKGTGQGLSVVHSVVVTKHGGTIEVDSTVGVGTTFTLSLPCRQVEPAPGLGRRQAT